MSSFLLWVRRAVVVVGVGVVVAVVAVVFGRWSSIAGTNTVVGGGVGGGGAVHVRAYEGEDMDGIKGLFWAVEPAPRPRPDSVEKRTRSAARGPTDADGWGNSLTDCRPPFAAHHGQ